MMITGTNFYPIYFSTLFSIYSIMLTILFLAIMFVSAMVTTEDRRWKAFSNVGWISGITMICVSITNAAVFSLTILLFVDVCNVVQKVIMDEDLKAHISDDYTLLTGFLQDCTFGEG
jgi:hypothetical protein